MHCCTLICSCTLSPTIPASALLHLVLLLLRLTHSAPAVLLCCRGKLLNVRDATALQISENVEIQHIKQILGLQHGKNYEDVKALRYGHLMIMTDQVRPARHKYSLEPQTAV